MSGTKAGWFLLLNILFMLLSLPLVNAWEIDETSTVTRIVDGDSFEITNDEVRLADVSAPEYYESGGTAATNAITKLIDGKQIYLDTDQKTGRDPYGRLVAVVYVKYNSTHYLNVNKALLNQGVVELTDYTNNEFSPSSWTLYTRYSDTQPTIIERVTPVASNLVTSLLSIAVILGLYKIGKPGPGGDGSIWKAGFSKYSLILLALLGLRILALFYNTSNYLGLLYLAAYLVSFIFVALKKKIGSILVIVIVCLETLLWISLESYTLTILWDLFILFLALNELKLRRTMGEQ